MSGRFRQKRVSWKLSSDSIVQRVIRIPSHIRIFPEPDLLFDLWHDGIPWASRIRRESCTCSRPGGQHSHRYIEAAELHAGIAWQPGTELRFIRSANGRIVVGGDVQP